VLCPYEAVVEKTRLFLGQDEDPAGTVGETFKRVSKYAAPPRLMIPAWNRRIPLHPPLAASRGK
jgi:hypothetical protein